MTADVLGGEPVAVSLAAVETCTAWFRAVGRPIPDVSKGEFEVWEPQAAGLPDALTEAVKTHDAWRLLRLRLARWERLLLVPGISEADTEAFMQFALGYRPRDWVVEGVSNPVTLVKDDGVVAGSGFIIAFRPEGAPKIALPSVGV